MQARKLRYLSAMGIDCWVRRSLAQPVAVPDAEPDAAPDPEPASGPGSGPEPEPARSHDGERAVVSVRTLLADDPQPASGQPAHGEAGGGPAADRERDIAAESTPEFRMVILQLDSALLLVDESLLASGEEQAGQLLLLGDLLRAALLLRHGTAAGRIERQVFYWPQLQDAAMDQSLPRATEALAFHLRMRLAERLAERPEGRDGLVLLVADPEAEGAEQGSAIALAGLATLELPYCLVTPRILAENGGAAARKDVWGTLQDRWSRP